MRFAFTAGLAIVITVLWILSNVCQQRPKHEPEERGTQEKYITFFPHSGLHNQRLGLINAVVLAKALNRTLILPELNLGKATYWRPTPLMEEKMARCPRLPIAERNGVCADYRKYVPVPVSSVFDLSLLDALGIRYVQRTDMSPSYFETVLGGGDYYPIEDDTRYSYRIYDTRNSTQSMLQYRHRIDLDDLAERPERFMIFGSLFGTPRLVLERPDLYWLRERLSARLGFSNPVVIQQALQVVSRLGGPGAFASVHLRTGDGVFKATMTQTMAKVRESLESLHPGRQLHHQHEDMVLQSIQELPSIPDRINTCVAIQNEQLHPRLQLIFMATDAAQPRRTVPQLFEEFVCLFTLSDFADVVQETVTGNTAASREQQEQHGPLLLPLIDAEVAAHGSFFVGTRKSTFSKYIQYRHQRYISLYS